MKTLLATLDMPGWQLAEAVHDLLADRTSGRAPVNR
jgi:hypothetical protein